MRRAVLLLSAGWLLMAAAPSGELEGLEIVGNDILSEQRGGFRFQDLTISLGADIRTFINGELALHTIVNWTPQGSTSETAFVSGVLTPASAAELQNGILSSGGITMRVGGQEVYLANGGQTALLHNTDGAIQNVLVNTASKVSMTQEVDATLTLGGYDNFRSDLDADRLRLNLNDLLGSAGIGSLGF